MLSSSVVNIHRFNLCRENNFIPFDSDGEIAVYGILYATRFANGNPLRGIAVSVAIYYGNCRLTFLVTFRKFVPIII